MIDHQLGAIDKVEPGFPATGTRESERSSAPLTPTALMVLNSGQSLLARWVRTAGYGIRGYREGYSNKKRDILRHACKADQIWCNTDIRYMYEALMTY